MWLFFLKHCIPASVQHLVFEQSSPSLEHFFATHGAAFGAFRGQPGERMPSCLHSQGLLDVSTGSGPGVQLGLQLDHFASFLKQALPASLQHRVSVQFSPGPEHVFATHGAITGGEGGL